jgi:phosphatidylserine synthase
MIVALLAFIVFIINIPFGFWRKSQKRFSLNWFLSIHVPVIISILLRYMAKIEFKWSILIIFVFVFIAGQFSGKILYNYRLETKNQTL